MIRPNYEYRVFRGKVASSGKYTTFSVGESERNKQTNQWETLGCWDIIVAGNFPCERDDRTTVKMTDITGVTRNDVTGRTYTNIFADAVVNYKGVTYVNGVPQTAGTPTAQQTYQAQTDAYRPQQQKPAVDSNGYPFIEGEDMPF